MTHALPPRNTHSLGRQLILEQSTEPTGVSLVQRGLPTSCAGRR
jgi:hypothetical protein